MRPHSTHTGTGGSAVNKAVAFLVKHPVSGSFFISLSIRTAAAVASNLMIDGVLIPDEGQYLLISRLASEGELTSEFWGGTAAHCLTQLVRSRGRLLHYFGYLAPIEYWASSCQRHLVLSLRLLRPA